jgi:hypothetical protein
MSFEKIPNPDNEPIEAETAYTRQNDILYALMAGVDTISPYVEDNNIILPSGGAVNIGLQLYVLDKAITIPIPDLSIEYFIKLLLVSGDILVSLTTDRGVFQPDKQAYYSADGGRILNTNYWRI